MKIVTGSDGKKKMVLSKKEWLAIGQNFSDNPLGTHNKESFKEFHDSLDPDNPAKLKPIIQLVTVDGELHPKTDFDRKKLDLIIGKHEFNPWPETVRSIEKRLWEVVRTQFGYKTDQNSGYFLLIDGKGVNHYIADFEANHK